MKVISRLIIRVTSCWSGSDPSLPESWSDWATASSPPHYVTIGTSCHQLSLPHVQSSLANHMCQCHSTRPQPIQLVPTIQKKLFTLSFQPKIDRNILSPALTPLCPVQSGEYNLDGKWRRKPAEGQIDKISVQCASCFKGIRNVCKILLGQGVQKRMLLRLWLWEGNPEWLLGE